MLAEAELNKKELFSSCFGLCLLANKLFGLGVDCFSNEYFLNHNDCWTENLKYFPEYKRKKPNNKSMIWLAGDKRAWDKRIKILKQCIIETY